MVRRIPNVLVPVGIAIIGAVAGCGSPITDLYDARRTELLADPGPAPAGWTPDGRLHLSPALVDRVVRAGLETYGTTEGTYEAAGPLGVRGDIAYDVAIRRVDIAGTDRCERCIQVDTRVRGDVEYRFGPVRGSTPVTVDASLDIRVDASADRDFAWTVTLAPQTVNAVDIEVRDLAVGVRGVIEERLTAWAREELVGRMEPIPLGTFGGEDLPIRALTVSATDDGGLTIDFLTRSPTYAPLGQTAPKIREGYQLDLSQRSLIGIAAKASLEAGPLSHGVIVEPTSLDVGPTGFSMGLRLWRPKGRGWWRDYTVTGEIAITDKAIDLTATNVEEVAQSKGAVMADPLAAVGESVILSTIEESVNTSLPSFQQAEAQGMRVSLTIASVRGSGGVLRVKGDVDIAAVPPSDQGRTEGGMQRPPRAPRPEGGMARPR